METVEDPEVVCEDSVEETLVVLVETVEDPEVVCEDSVEETLVVPVATVVAVLATLTVCELVVLDSAAINAVLDPLAGVAVVAKVESVSPNKEE